LSKSKEDLRLRLLQKKKGNALKKNIGDWKKSVKDRQLGL
jgi:hypothetical protein